MDPVQLLPRCGDNLLAAGRPFFFDDILVDATVNGLAEPGKPEPLTLPSNDRQTRSCGLKRKQSFYFQFAYRLNSPRPKSYSVNPIK